MQTSFNKTDKAQVRPDLKETLALCDHVREPLRGSQVVTQIFLIGTTRSVLLLD